MTKTVLAVEVDGVGEFYWELYDRADMSYLAVVETDDFGDYLANNKDYNFVLHTQEPYQVMTDIHIELDKWFGQPDDHLDDCDSIHDPSSELDYFCEGCKAFTKWTEGKTYGDYYSMLEKRKKVSYV